MATRRFVLPLACASLVVVSRAQAGMGAGVHFDAIVDRVSLVFDAEVTDAIQADKYGNAIDFTIRDVHVLRGAFPAGATHVTFEWGNWGETGKPDYVDPGSAFEASKVKSGRWIFLGKVTNERATAVHVRPISDLAMVERRLGLPVSASPSAGASVAPSAEPPAAPSAAAAPAPPPVRPAPAGCGCVFAGNDESGAWCAIALAVVAYRRRAFTR